MRRVLLCMLLFSAAGTAASERVLNFTEDRSLGELWVQEDGEERKGLWFNPFNDIASWRMLSRAVGGVRVPAGERVKLVVDSKAWQEAEGLAPLKGLDSNALYALDLSNVWPPDRPVTDACMPYVRHLTGLRQLDLGDSTVTARGLNQLAGMRHLERIGLPKHLSNGGLATVVRMKSLTSVRLRPNRVTDRGFELLAELPNLKELVLEGEQLTDEGLGVLPRLTKLEYLLLRPGKGAFSVQGYAHIAGIPSLRTLWIDSHDCSDEKLELFADHPTLENLNLHWEGQITDRGVRAVCRIPKLKRLDIVNARITEQSLYCLGGCGGLEVLELPGGGYTDRGIEGLSGLRQLRELRASTASNSPLTDASLAAIAKLERLEKLGIAGTGFTDAGIERLAGMRTLRELAVGAGPQVTDAGLAKLAGLEKLERLYWFWGGDITFEGLNRFGSHRRLKVLQCWNVRRGDVVLDLSGMEGLEQLRLEMPREYDKENRTDAFQDAFKDEDLACLAGLRNLTSLQLYGNGIGDGGLAYLEDLDRLDTLFLGDRSRITDAGLRHLTRLERLWQLMIHDGHFTDGALKVLAEADSLAIIELGTDKAISDEAVAGFRAGKKNLKHLNIRPIGPQAGPTPGR